MTIKDAVISSQILALIAKGKSPVEALRIVCGADAVDAMITRVYNDLRAKAMVGQA